MRNWRHYGIGPAHDRVENHHPWECGSRNPAFTATDIEALMRRPPRGESVWVYDEDEFAALPVEELPMPKPKKIAPPRGKRSYQFYPEGAVCSVPGCGRLPMRRGLCNRCYNRDRRGSPPWAPKPPPRRQRPREPTIEERMAVVKVIKRRTREPVPPCKGPAPEPDT